MAKHIGALNESIFMKKTIILLIFLFVFFLGGHSVRIITGFDIARWYLDADLVLICHVKKIDTYTVSKHDSLVDDGFHLRYSTLREQYHISIDSIIKASQFIDEKMDTILTPNFSTSFVREKKEFTGFDSKGDSIFLCQLDMSEDYNDDGYFRLKSLGKYLVILQKTEIGYVINYQSECDSITLNLIRDVRLKGEDYFQKPDINE